MSSIGSFWTFKDEYFGDLLPLIQDANVTDINYDGSSVWVEDIVKGKYKSEVNLSREFVNQFSTRVANSVSAKFNQFSNVVEAETEVLRISIIHDSVSNTGMAISIRKTPALRRLTRESMIETGYASSDIIDLIENCVKGKMNMVFCGLPGSGKTELLKYCTQFIPKEEKVMTVEDNLEIHYRTINPDSNCVELKVHEELFSYTKAIKTALRQNASSILLSEARSSEVIYLIESLSSGLHGLTTLHTDDVRKVPDRVQNMMHDSLAASRLENDVYSFLNVAVLLRKKVDKTTNNIVRYIDQVSFMDRVDGKNLISMIVEDGKIVSKEVPKNIAFKFKLFDAEPFAKGVL